MKLTPSSRQALEGGDRLIAVFRLAPDAGAGDAHGAETEAVNGDVAADPKGPGFDGMRRPGGAGTHSGGLGIGHQGVAFTGRGPGMI